MRAPLRQVLLPALVSPTDTTNLIVSAGGGAASPVMDNILALWAPGAVSGSGGLADAWVDTSGNGIHATGSGASRPTLNANGTVSFVAGKKLSAPDAGTVAQPITFCLRMRAGGALGRFFGAQDGAALYIASGTFRMFAGSDVNTTLALAADQWNSLIVVFNGATSAAYTSTGSATGLNPGTSGMGSNAGVSFNDPSFFGGTGPWDLAAAIAYAGALDAVPANVTQTLAYLDSINPA